MTLPPVKPALMATQLAVAVYCVYSAILQIAKFVRQAIHVPNVQMDIH
jgi:hypothetical protein